MPTRATTLMKLKPLSAAMAGAVLLSLVGCSSSPKQADTAVPNPFAVSGSGAATQVHMNTLRVFGDSYSDPSFTNSVGSLNWATELGKETASPVLNYAIGGARTAPVNRRAFKFQMDAMEAAGQGKIGDGDLTVIYLGHNDINSTGSSDNLARAKGAYAEGVQRLKDLGAAAPNRRLFVAQIHDWSRNPRSTAKEKVRSEVLAWNQYLGELANTDPNIVAVDLFTVFERIYTSPGSFGFVNVSTPDAKRSGSDTLYTDISHFGSKGQMLIERVYKHYLTRAWDWSNTINSGSEAAQRLGQDIDANVFALNSDTGAVLGSRFSLIPIQGANGSAARADGRVFNRHLIGPGAGSAQQAFASAAAPTGVALEFNGGNVGETRQGQARFGLALTQNDLSRKLASTDSQTAQRLNSTGTTLYWVQPMSDFLFSSQLSHLSLSRDSQSFDPLINRSVNNLGFGETWSFEQKIRRNLGNDQVSFTPWLSLTSQSSSLKPYLSQTLYTTDTQFSGSRASDLLSGIGFDMTFKPFTLGQGRKLSLGGGIKHTQSLYRESVQVAMREAANTGFVQRETVQRGPLRSTLLGFNAALDMSKNVQLRAAYATDLQRHKASQSLNLTANFSY
jgi:lysophospholipase L1-like esterase